MNAPELIKLIQELDTYEISDGDEGLCVMRWENGSGSSDDKAGGLLRGLVRERLGSFDLADIGAAVLKQIDERAAT